jgi:hypothetical protein
LTNGSPEPNNKIHVYKDLGCTGQEDFMENLLKIITLPDNIPIVGIFVASIYFIWLSFKKALKNDELIRNGKQEEIIDEIEK